MSYINKTIVTQPLSELTFDNKWSSGFCECCTDCKSCCTALWCWPCFLCCLDEAARECSCTSYGISLLCFNSIGIAILRAKLRGAYKIHGSVLDDCFITSCCPCCTSLQMYRELKFRGEINP